MLRLVPRSPENLGKTIAGLPGWVSDLLRARGVDTPEKADFFLHPDLKRLHDPFAMQDMDRACAIIRENVESDEAILVYGDYDVDGITATAILTETLAEMGARVDWRIPKRSEGYGLNADAVREIAAGHRLLITVDCGITNHEEVRLAQSLGMQVIVTDHHELADTPSPADAALNPLLGDYPFRRLCGAGVALKLTQALMGMEAVERRLDLAVLATVADMVPLADENRIIVREGLRRIAETERPGLRALLEVSEVPETVNAGHVGFQLAPRLNAGGRLEDAAQGVRLLTTRDPEEAGRIALHLNELNGVRRAMETEITAQAEQTLLAETDFLTDRVLIVMGEGWNRGVIGLAAGKLCEKYHFPTVVLSADGEEAVGSCRSIRGVHIQRALMACKDLLIRFGGHEMAAGLTIRRELVPELRRRLNEAVAAQCDPLCYIPTQEYDTELRLGQVDLGLVEELSLLQPTGLGNPNPLFLTRDAQLQASRRVGNAGQHLKLTLAQGETVRDGIAFQQGDLAEKGLERVDAVYTPERNEFRGSVSAQLQVAALCPAAGSAPLPGGEGLLERSLQEIFHLASNINKIPVRLQRIRAAQLRALAESGRNLLLIGHGRPRAADALSRYPLDTAFGQVEDVRAFNTLLFAPEEEQLRDVWRHIVLLDGEVLPGEKEMLRSRCPRAEILALEPCDETAAWVRGLAMTDETLRGVYRLLQGRWYSLEQLTAETGLTRGQTVTALQIFREAGLADYSLAPWRVTLLPWKVKRAIGEASPTLRYLRSLN